MSQIQVPTDPGYVRDISFGLRNATTPGGAATTVLSNKAGILGQIVVTGTGGTGITTLWDNASAGSGIPLFVVPANATQGTIYPVRMSNALGITAVGAAGSAALTVSLV